MLGTSSSSWNIKFIYKCVACAKRKVGFSPSISIYSVYYTQTYIHSYSHRTPQIWCETWVYVYESQSSLPLCMSYLSRMNTSNVRYTLWCGLVWLGLVWFSWVHVKPPKENAHTILRGTDNMMMWFCLKGNSHHGNKTKQKCREWNEKQQKMRAHTPFEKGRKK